MPIVRKRPSDAVDAAGHDELHEARAKRPASQAARSVLGTGDSSECTSQFLASPSAANVVTDPVPAATQEPDFLDLTQEDDGPPKELYGSNGQSIRQVS